MTAGADQPGGSPVGERATAIWRAARAPLAVAVLVVLGSVLLAVTGGRPVGGELDPTSTAETGSRAVATLLRDAGVEVLTPRASADVTAAGAGSTVLVAFPDRLSGDQLDAVRRSGADLVLVAPGQRELAVLAPAVTVAADGTDRTGRSDGPVEDREPACDLAAARVAGVVELGGVSYRSAAGTGCYPDGAGAGLVRVADNARTVTVLGSGEPLGNGRLASEGNAALAVQLLGGRPRLLWYLPVPEAAADRRPLAELVPAGWRWAPLQLAVAVVLAALWRGRRLGALVTEPLPVVVRAAETTEGRARLYRRAGAREHAAECLRAATRARLAGSVGLGRTAGEAGDTHGRGANSDVGRDPSTLIEAVAARTGRPAARVRALLYGPAPRDDRDMVELADQLDDCEREVRRS